jgi:membrane protease YdiL (CAAX protease family)
MQERSRRTALALCAVGALFGLGTCTVVAPATPDDASELGVASLGLELILASVAVAGALASRRPLRDRLGLGQGRLPPGALALLVLGTLSLSQALDALAALSGLRQDSALAGLDAALREASGAGAWLAFLGIGIAPGIGEELLCRGLVQRGLERSLGPPAAVAIAALFFGALHLDPLHGVLASLLGLYLGTVALLSGGIRAAILCHACNNAVAVVLASRAPDLFQPGAGTALAGLALAGLCLAAASRTRPVELPPAPGGPGRRRALQPGNETDDL